MQYELMTGWLNTPSFISSLTTEQFMDLGYTVIPEPSSFVCMSLLGCVGMAYSLRRKVARWFSK